MADVDYFDLGVTFGLEPSQAKAKIKDLPAYGSWPAIANNIENAKLRYPDAYGRQKYIGWTDEQFLNLSACSAAALQAVWYGQFQQWGADIWSRVNVDIPAGDYFMTVPFPKAMGQYIGKGPHLGWNPRQAATCLHVWKDQWQGPANEDRFAMRSANWGKTDVGDAWMHAGFVDSIGFVGNNGNNWFDPNSPTEHGLGLWDEGEASDIGRIYSADWNGYGIMVVRGTPFTASSVLSVFTNALGGVGLIGSQLSSMRIGTVSGDDNAAMIVMADGYGRKAGGNLHVGMVKSESGKRPINHGQVVLWQRNPCVGNISFGSVQADQNGVYNDAAFVVHNREWGQVLNVGAFVGWNLCTLVHDVTNKKRWATSSYHPESFAYCSRNGGTLFDLTTGSMMASSGVNATDRLGMASSPSGFNYTNGTPAYSVTGGVAPPPNAPTIDSFTATPSSLTGAGTVTLAWQTTNATSVTISGVSGTLPVDGNTTVQVSTTTTYTLTATGSGGTTSTAVTIAVSATPPSGNLSRTGWTAKASSSDGTNTPEKAINGNVNDFWMASGSMTTSSPTFTVDTKKSQVMKGTTFAAPPGYAGSWPRTFEVLTSNSNSDNPTDASFVSRGKFNGAFNSQATFTATGRHMRIICRTANSDWMGISDLNIQG